MHNVQFSVKKNSYAHFLSFPEKDLKQKTLMQVKLLTFNNNIYPKAFKKVSSDLNNGKKWFCHSVGSFSIDNGNSNDNATN